MSDASDTFDESDRHTEGMWAATARATSRYGRRLHDHTDRWDRYETRQDRD